MRLVLIAHAASRGTSGTREVTAGDEQQFAPLRASSTPLVLSPATQRVIAVHRQVRRRRITQLVLQLGPAPLQEQDQQAEGFDHRPVVALSCRSVQVILVRHRLLAGAGSLENLVQRPALAPAPVATQRGNLLQLGIGQAL